MAELLNQKNLHLTLTHSAFILRKQPNDVHLKKTEIETPSLRITFQGSMQIRYIVLLSKSIHTLQKTKYINKNSLPQVTLANSASHWKCYAKPGLISSLFACTAL